MAYEEVLFFIYFCEKKKYFGVAYKKEINFMPDKLFIIEINIIKQDNF